VSFIVGENAECDEKQRSWGVVGLRKRKKWRKGRPLHCRFCGVRQDDDISTIPYAKDVSVIILYASGLRAQGGHDIAVHVHDMAFRSYPGPRMTICGNLKRKGPRRRYASEPFLAMEREVA